MVRMVSTSPPLTAAFNAFTLEHVDGFGVGAFGDAAAGRCPPTRSLIAARSSAVRPRLVAALTSAPAPDEQSDLVDVGSRRSSMP